ncbi:MAG: PP2C family protein-serine/threonine phosphatase [Acutalibacteraceae bacterium]
MAIFHKKRKKDNEYSEDGYLFFESFVEKQAQDNAEKAFCGALNDSQAVPQVPLQNSIPFNGYAPDTNIPFSADYSPQKTEEIPGLAKGSPEYSEFQGEQLVGTSIIVGKRSSQQDAIATSEPNVVDRFPQRWLGVLCDGMGGMNGGERASALSVKKTIESYRQFIAAGSVDIPTFYRELISKIDFEVSSLEDEEGNYLGAGTTFTSVFIDNGKLYWASVGDSHIYVMRENQIKMVVREHNYLMDLLEMVQAGEITYEEAYSDKSKDALTSYIGMGGVSLMDIISRPVNLLPGDIVMLCSDGLYRSVSDEEILQIVSGNSENMQKAAESLTQFAMMKNNPYQDNTSVVLARYK